jgi:hypothetical protein
MGDSPWVPGMASPPRSNVIQRDPQPRRGWAERRVLGISLQMNMAPRSAVSPPGALANVGMFAVTKCLENRILRASENPPSPGAATAPALLAWPPGWRLWREQRRGGQAYEVFESARRNLASEMAAKMALIARSTAVGNRTPEAPLPERMMARKPRITQ